MHTKEPKIIVALDHYTLDAALECAHKLHPSLCHLKVGKGLFTNHGPIAVKKLKQLGYEIFLDLKFHDIPVQVARAAKAAAELGVLMITVHAAGGLAMMRAAVEAVRDSKHPETKVLAVTLLTSLDAEDLRSIGVQESPLDYVLRLSALAQQAGVTGVVSSPLELAALRQARGEQFLLVTPGIRFDQSDSEDQKRVLGPKEALAAGSHYLVLGRPITTAEQPRLVLEAYLRELS